MEVVLTVDRALMAPLAPTLSVVAAPSTRSAQATSTPTQELRLVRATSSQTLKPMLVCQELTIMATSTQVTIIKQPITLSKSERRTSEQSSSARVGPSVPPMIEEHRV